MSKVTIQEGNKLIIEFMGYEFHKGYFILKGPNSSVSSMIRPQDLYYHEDWNRLMQVIQKIEKTYLHPKKDDEINYTSLCTFRENMTRFYCFSLFQGETQIESAWLAVVDFIKWYNEKNL